jgi:glycerate-2-kinase
VIGRFPWDPFPQGEPPPKGDDPLLAALYRGAIEGADAYRAVRAAVRRDAGVLRVGNRFVPDGRYREVAFVALGHASSSMALALLHVFGDRLTQGFLSGPGDAPASLPFRSETVADGWGGADAAPRVVEAAREIAGGMRESDLFVLLLSPGALGALLLPPPGLDRAGFASLLVSLHDAGATAADLVAVVRVVGTGGVAGRLLPPGIAADVQCLIVDRGDGAVAVGGGPTFPPTDAERTRARAVLEGTGLLASLPATARTPLSPSGADRAAPSRRPVVVAGPADALRSAGDAVFDKGWTARVGALGLEGRPATVAAKFLESVEAVVAAEHFGEGTRTKGLAVLTTLTLDLPEGVPERAACEEFLALTRAALRRREMSVGLFRTAGPTASSADFAGGAVGAPTEPSSSAPGATVRPIRVPAGITDVGLLAAALIPAPASSRGPPAGRGASR